MNGVNLEDMVLVILVIIPAIALHEFGHAKFADLAGDPTPRAMGRVTLNPVAHFDPLGFVMIIITSLSGFGIGWGRPVIVDPRRMNNPRWDHFVSVLAGPMMNILQAVVYGLGARVALRFGGSDLLIDWLFLGVEINLSLCFFNLIPFGPLDGHWLVGTFLPDKQRLVWNRFSQSTGAIILFGLIVIGQFSPQYSIITLLIRPPVEALSHKILPPLP